VTEWLSGWHLYFVFRRTGFEIWSRGSTRLAEICKGARCVVLTTFPPSCADCLEFWEPQPPGTLRACPGRHRDYLPTYSMVQSPSWEANWFATSQEIPRISRNPKVHYRTHKRPPPVSILGQLNPVHTPTTHLLEIHPNIIHPSTPRSPQWSPSLRFPQQDPIHPPLLTHTRHMPSPSHSSRFYHPRRTGISFPLSILYRKVVNNNNNNNNVFCLFILSLTSTIPVHPAKSKLKKKKKKDHSFEDGNICCRWRRWRC